MQNDPQTHTTSAVTPPLAIPNPEPLAPRAPMGKEKPKIKIPKFVLGLFAAILLLGGLAAGLYLSSNRTIFQQRATSCTPVGGHCEAGKAWWCYGDRDEQGTRCCNGSGYNTNPAEWFDCPAPPSGCMATGNSASACNGHNPGDNVGVCTCQLSNNPPLPANDCKCVSNTTCSGSGGQCYTGATCSGLNPPLSVINGGAGCGTGQVCCSLPGTLSPSPSPNPVGPSSTPAPIPGYCQYNSSNAACNNKIFGYNPPGTTCACRPISGSTYNCACNAFTPTPPPIGGGGTPTPIAGCSTLGNSCNNISNRCCTNIPNVVCTPNSSGANVCNQNGGSICQGGGVCGQLFYGFKCSFLTNGQCLPGFAGFISETRTATTFQAAKDFVGTCGQVDEVCRGGSNQGTLCGGFEIYSTGCGGGGFTPAPTSPATPTTASGSAQCQQTSMVNITRDGGSPRIGDNISFTGFGTTNILGDTIDQIEFTLRINGVIQTGFPRTVVAVPNGTVRGSFTATTTYVIARSGTHSLSIRVHSVRQGWRD